MDPLSLLAELYGDGRDTVGRMRCGGLENLEDLCNQKPQGLARMLKVSERSARKIISEAKEMLQGTLFVPEEKPAQPPRFLPPSPGQGLKAMVLDLVAKRFR